jgi:hypothetical protein
MKKYSFFILFIFFIICSLHAQAGNAYLIPRQIYVGDPASLILPLPAADKDEDYFITAYDKDLMPSDPNVDIHRVILERRRTTGSRLIIEFTPFAAGTLALPGIEIGDEYFFGLTINVNSLIDVRSEPVLSAPASALSMPGTAVMLYGSMALFVLLILFIFWFIFKGRAAIKKIRKKWKRLRLFKNMKNTEKRLYKALSKGAEKREILDKLSNEFKSFLSILIGKDCCAMTAREFIEYFTALPKDLFATQEDTAYFLGSFFRKCDELRFSGSDIDIKAILHLLSELRLFTGALEKNEKNEKKARRAA